MVSANKLLAGYPPLFLPLTPPSRGFFSSKSACLSTPQSFRVDVRMRRLSSVMRLSPLIFSQRLLAREIHWHCLHFSRRLPHPPFILPTSPHLHIRLFSSSPSSSVSPPPSPSYAPLLSNVPPSLPLILPTYARSLLKPGILHFSVGQFHRAHLAYYIDSLLHLTPLALPYGIIGVGVRPADRQLSQSLKAQHCHYTLISRGASGEEVRVIGSMMDYVYAPEEAERLMERLVSSDLRLVSLTITEAGYDLKSNTETQIDISNLSAIMRGQVRPVSVMGWTVLGIEERRRAGLPPFTLLSCDNLQHNGSTLKSSLVEFTQRGHQPSLASFIENSISCPSSMVDRITPAFQSQHCEEVREKYGITDRCPVFTEDWVQWVVEDKAGSFPSGRPPIELLKDGKYNILLVENVDPYERMKLRLLNATHSVICYLGYLAGCHFIHEIMAQPTLSAFARAFLTEASSTLNPVPGLSISAYCQCLLTRFANPHIHDTALRVCMDGASKWPKFLVPTLRAVLAGEEAQVRVKWAALGLAGWFRFLEGRDEEGKEIPIHDSLAVQLGLPEVARGRPGARQLLDKSRVVFEDLSDDPILIAEVQRALDSLHSVGAKETVKLWTKQ